MAYTNDTPVDDMFTVGDCRDFYRYQMELAASRLGWDPATLKAEAAHLARMYQDEMGYHPAKAWWSAAQEAVTVACEALDA